ncbi:MAG TPA: hypothetical protein VGD17_02840 [Chitinophagaceae bacterium]
MRFIILTVFIISLVAAYCTKKEEIPIPPCIQLKIDSIKKLPKTDPPIQVHAWDYGGRRVYLFSAACCDQLVKVFDANCNYVCAPSGGITGYGDSTCTDFYQAAQHGALLWKDDR